MNNAVLCVLQSGITRWQACPTYSSMWDEAQTRLMEEQRQQEEQRALSHNHQSSHRPRSAGRKDEAGGGGQTEPLLGVGGGSEEGSAGPQGMRWLKKMASKAFFTQ